LYERGWEIMRPYFDQPRSEALVKLRALLGTGRASADTAEILSAAMAGKVEVLLADPHVAEWGMFDVTAGKVRECDGAQTGSEDLVNLAIAETLLHGGNVFAAQQHELPTASPVAAILRY
jgi:hypothetical protein